MKTNDFLLEIGCEELPAEYLAEALTADPRSASASLAATAAAVLDAKEIALPWRTVESFGTPRRLILRVGGLPPRLTRVAEGPPVAVAFDPAGQPTAAARGFAKQCGVPVARLTRRDAPQGARLVSARPISVTDLLAAAIPKILHHLAFPKTMRWEASGLRFARPIRWLMALYGDRVVPCRVGEVTAGAHTFPRRRSGGRAVRVAGGAAYFSTLRRLGVTARVGIRGERTTPGPGQPIRWTHGDLWTDLAAELAKAARAAGGRLPDPATDEPCAALLKTVAGMAEQPVVVRGQFRREYLALPPEVLATSMATHLKLFNVTSADGRTLRPAFLAVLEGRPPAPAVVTEHLERILEARFSDAQFFWREDAKTSLEAKVPLLQSVVFHQRLGTLDDKIVRLLTVAEHLGVNAAPLARAIRLAKADLVTQMVKEFPTLQGVIGAEYAAHDGEPSEVVQAIREQYAPRTAADPLPGSPTGTWLSLLDRADTLAGYFGIGLVPTSSADPYGLRRQALGVVRILVERPLSLPLGRILDEAIRAWGKHLTAPAADCRVRLTEFLLDRFRWWACELRRYPRELVEAVLDAYPGEDLANVAMRLEQLHVLWKNPQDRQQILFRAGKVVERTGRIVLSSKERRPFGEVNPEKFTTPEEQILWQHWRALKPQVEKQIGQQAYRQATTSYGALYPQIHAFFEKVFVMDDDPEVRRNRLALLNDIYVPYASQVANLLKLPLPPEL